ncbi:hypothetical protein EZS27_023032 [termite gut metagenome]|uniref:Uncharacterized protein n=1 Tax=termite gut metagenome TaxID=433724 RepID=A0A5J4R2U4_9ZZZZ
MNKLFNEFNPYEFPPIEEGEACSIEIFFEKVIEWQFCNANSIKKLHNALMNYIELPLATFFIRAYGSSKNYLNLRRGFLTCYSDGLEYVFCDNTFVQQ